MNPLVSVPIITYNHEKFICNAINSVLAQNYDNIEIIISDDASTDNTIKMIEPYIVKYPEKIKLLQSKENIGSMQNWYKCLKFCKGKYIAGLSGDDEFLPNKISKQVSVMESDENVAIVYTDAQVFDVALKKNLYNLSDKSPVISGNIITALEDSLYYSPTIMFCRKFLPEENIFLGLRHGADLAFYKQVMILSAPSGKIQYINEVLYLYMKHGSNITSTQYDYRIDHIKAVEILQQKYPTYQKHLYPPIYDFCFVAFLKNLYKLNINLSFYFLITGLKAARYNIIRFTRPLLWGIKFKMKTLLRKF